MASWSAARRSATLQGMLSTPLRCCGGAWVWAWVGPNEGQGELVAAHQQDCWQFGFEEHLT